MQGEKAKRGRPRKNRPYVPNSCGTNTLTMGPRLRFREHMTKGEFVQVLQDMEEYTGNATNAFEPLGGHHKGVRWARWPGQRPEVIGGKELRFVRESPVWKDSSRAFPWPEVGDDARTLWRDDPTRAVEHGMYETQLVSYGSAPCWNMWEVEMVRQAFGRRGVLVGSSARVRGLRFRPEPDLEA